MDRISQWPSDAAGDGDTPPKSFTLSVSLARPGWLWSTSGRPDHGQFPTGLGSCSRYDHPLRLLTTSVISHLSVISHQSSAISHQPSAISAIGHQPSAIRHQSAVSSFMHILIALGTMNRLQQQQSAEFIAASPSGASYSARPDIRLIRPDMP